MSLGHPRAALCSLGWHSWHAALACLQLGLVNEKRFQVPVPGEADADSTDRTSSPSRVCSELLPGVIWDIHILLGSSWPLLHGAFRFDQTDILKQPGVS